MSFESLLPQFMEVQRLVSTTDQTAVGTLDARYKTVSGLEAVPCRREQISGIERLLAGREGVENLYRLFYAAGYTLQDNDHVIIGSTTYEIEGITEIYDASELHHYETTLILRK